MTPIVNIMSVLDAVAEQKKIDEDEKGRVKAG